MTGRLTGIPDGPELLGGLKPAAVTTMATPVMGVLVTPGEPAVGPPGHEPAASAAAWTEAFPSRLGSEASVTYDIL